MEIIGKDSVWTWTFLTTLCVVIFCQIWHKVKVVKVLQILAILGQRSVGNRQTTALLVTIFWQLFPSSLSVTVLALANSVPE